MKVLKILGVVFGALLLLTAIALFAGSAVVGAGQKRLNDELARQGLAGPVKGTVTSVDQGSIYTVKYTDKQGTEQTGTGSVVGGTKPPSVGDEVNVYYTTTDPSKIAILDLPGGDIGGLATGLRTAGIACLIVGAILLLAGIVGLVSGRKARTAVMAGQGGVPQPIPAGQPAPGSGQQYPPQQGLQDPSQQQVPPPQQQYPPTA